MSNKKRRLGIAAVVAALLFTLTTPVGAEESGLDTLKLETMKVRSLEENLRRKGLLKDVIEKTQVITAEDFEAKQAASLFEVIQCEPGVTVNTECSMCGIKRVQVNGLKGEHTTVLVDGVPMHSTVSSYYGMDALATAGLSRMEIARGAGASLLAPEAIGGTLNLIFDKPTKSGITTDTAFGSNDYRGFNLAATFLSDDESMALLAIGQYDNIAQEDADDNLVNEAPRLENNTFTLKGFYDYSDTGQIQLRISKIKSDVHGGYMSDNYHAVLQDVGDPAFVDGDLNKRYAGGALGTSEYILTEREEVTAQWIQQISDRTNITVIGSYAMHLQDSTYEGFDYHNEVPSIYGTVKLNYSAGSHLFTYGASIKTEELESDSTVVDSDPELIPDSYDYANQALFLQDTWQIAPGVELIAALRADKITVDWTGNTARKDEVDETIFAPRLHLRWDHTGTLVSRFSFGRGYRAPLTFFESEHGILEDGFNVNITELEDSWSGGYSISYQDIKWAGTVGIHYATVDNLATIDTDNFDRPTLINSDETGEVTALDASGSYKFTDWLVASLTYEKYFMSDDYKATFGIAPIEERVGFSLDIDKNGWDFVTSVYWIGSRDLTDYGYEGYDVYNESTGEVSGLKSSKAPSYYTVDMKLSKQLGKHFNLYIGGKNLLDYTQAGDEESPLFFDDEGGYDVGYIYGPLRGRTVYAGLKTTF
ncbi:MAG: TonB-dependent receptor [Syntrophaceae bacterium]|nr:TonB-dependent receptor [Syntrophaceae bacterium]